MLLGAACCPSTGADTPAAGEKVIPRQAAVAIAHVAHAVSIEAVLTAKAFTACAALADATGQRDMCCKRSGAHAAASWSAYAAA